MEKKRTSSEMCGKCRKESRGHAVETAQLVGAMGKTVSGDKPRQGSISHPPFENMSCLVVVCEMPLAFSSFKK